ncbi:MAG TPA: RNA pseudouridine synthase, partial [Bacilli bacterium]|nr:RNA pseudouridine synthase [Bacilli bacterium]
MEDGKIMTNINIIYEDNHIIVVEKPVNILSQSDITGDIDMLSLVKEYVKNKYNKPGNVYVGLVHRLDRPVGGLMVFAKTSKAAQRLNKEILDKRFIKTYLVLLNGNLKTSGRLINCLYKDSSGVSKVVEKDTKDAKEAILEYEIVKYFEEENKTLVKVNLITGRHHQIRLQFNNIGYPIYGDQRYTETDRKTQIYLYAYKLSFKHPVKDEI